MGSNVPRMELAQVVNLWRIGKMNPVYCCPTCHMLYIRESNDFYDAFTRGILIGQCENNHNWVMESPSLYAATTGMSYDF